MHAYIVNANEVCAHCDLTLLQRSYFEKILRATLDTGYLGHRAQEIGYDFVVVLLGPPAKISMS